MNDKFIVPIAVFTASRAEFGLLKELCLKLERDSTFQLKLIVAGAHLSRKHGNTIQEILKENILPSVELPIDLDNNEVHSMAELCGDYIKEISKALQKLNPQCLILLGDRYETFAAAASAHLNNISILHIHGGEKTDGALDDSLRHAISQLSKWHFTAADQYKQRVIKMLGRKDDVFNIGPMALDQLRKIEKISKSEFETKTGYKFAEHNLLVTYHPETGLEDNGITGFTNLLTVLDEIDANILFTHPNADDGSNEILAKLIQFSERNSTRCSNIASLGHYLYLNALHLFDAVIGNSSSGIIEAPLVGIPVLNLGDRQGGRIRRGDVIESSLKEDDIRIKLLELLGHKSDSKSIPILQNYNNSPSQAIIDFLRKKFEVSA